MPIYNGARYLRPALRSILNQTLREIELIAIDDASTDDTAEILRRAAKMDSRVRLIQNPSNLGLVGSLNSGVEAARGRFIARMDQDDISHRRRLEVQTRWLETSRCEVCGTWTWNFSRWGGELVRFPEANEAIQAYLLFNSAVAHPTVLAYAEILKRHRYNDSYRLVEDYELWARLSLEGYRLGNVPAPLLKYRLHASQMGKASQKEQHRAAMLVRKQYLLGRYQWATETDTLTLESITQTTRGISLEELQVAGDLFVKLSEGGPAGARAVLSANWHGAALRAMGNGPAALTLYKRFARALSAPPNPLDLKILAMLRAVYGSRAYRALRSVHRFGRRSFSFLTPSLTIR